MEQLILLAFLFFLYRWFRKRIETAGSKGGKTEGYSRFQSMLDKVEAMGSGQWREMKHVWQDVNGETRQSGMPFSYFPMPEPTPLPEPRALAQGEGFGDKSQEGMDICDPSLGHNRDRIVLSPLDEPEGSAQASGGALLDLTGDALVRAVVMSEVLERPAKRKWGRR